MQKKPLFLKMIGYNYYMAAFKKTTVLLFQTCTTQHNTETYENLQKIASQPYQCDELGCTHLPSLCLQIQQSLCLR